MVEQEIVEQDFDDEAVVSEENKKIDSLRPKSAAGIESFDRDIKEWGKLQKIIESAEAAQARLISNISNECNETENLTTARYKAKLTLILGEFTDGKVSKMMSKAEMDMAKSEDAMEEYNIIAKLIDPEFEGEVVEEEAVEEFTEFD